VYNRHHDQISTYRSTRTVYGDAHERDSRTMRYENRDRSVTNRSREYGREQERERTNTNQRRGMENSRNSETTEWRNRNSDAGENRTRTGERSNTSRSFGERSTNQNNRVFEQPRENRSSNSGGSRPAVRQESRSSQPSIRSSESHQSSGGQSQRSNSGSGSGSSGSGSGKRGRN